MSFTTNFLRKKGYLTVVFKNFIYKLNPKRESLKSSATKREEVRIPFPNHRRLII